MCLEVSLPFFFIAVYFFTLSSGNIPRQGQDSDCTRHTSMCTNARSAHDLQQSLVPWQPGTVSFQGCCTGDTCLRRACNSFQPQAIGIKGVRIVRDARRGRREVHSTTYLRLLSKVDPKVFYTQGSISTECTICIPIAPRDHIYAFVY